MPREGIVTDVGTDYITLGVGNTWPVGLMELRKHDSYRVRLDRSLSNVPLKVQRLALDELRKDKAGVVARELVQLFYNQNVYSGQDFVLHDKQQVTTTLDKVSRDIDFKPNESQREAVVWALSRRLGLIRGPPGVSALDCLRSRKAFIHIHDRKRTDWKDPSCCTAHRYGISIATRQCRRRHRGGRNSSSPCFGCHSFERSCRCVAASATKYRPPCCQGRKGR